MLLVARNTLRPQLPYLAQPSPIYRGQLSRLLSTETKRYWFQLTYDATKWTAVIWIFLFLGGVAMQGIQIEMDEREKPTPSEWRFWTRDGFREARREMSAVAEQRAPVVDWAKAGFGMKKVLDRLEDEAKEGKGLKPAGGEDGEVLLIPDVGKAGFDISGKSHEWRTGYFEAVMGCAKAAEHLEDRVLDTTRKIVFPRENMIGPSNPDPRPTPTYAASAPREEDCERAFQPPETFYMRVLTGHGFTTRQKLDAAEGYATWLEFKGTPGAAEEMYRWGVDIAKAALPTSDSLMDSRSAVLQADGEGVSVNLLRATTALATHYARTGDVASALPVFLSVLRARRNAHVAPTYADPNPPPEQAKTDIGAAINFFSRVFRPTKFPPPGPTGDAPYVRLSEKPTCEDSELMIYIGEILFAQRKSEEGVGWTRQGVTIAEANLQHLSQSGTDGAKEENRKCKECLITGVGNWEIMLRRLSEQESTSSGREGGRNAGILEWRGWFGGDGGAKGQTLDEASTGMLEQELKHVERLRERIVREGIEEEMARQRGGGPAGLAGIFVG